MLVSFRVAGVALGDIRRVSGGMCVRDRRGIKVGACMREAAKTSLSPRVRRCAPVVLRGKGGAL